MGTTSGGDTTPIPIAGLGAVSDTASFYEVLGVPDNAPTEEIRSAYFRLAREFPPADHPQVFQRVSIASQTLSDPRRRNEYDQLRRAGRRVQVLVDQAAISVEKDPVKAMTMLKSAIALAPDTPRPRLLLAQVLMRIDEPQNAERQYRWLLKEAPRDETLHLKLARCLLAQDRLDEAEQALATATKINARYYEAYVLLARLYERTHKHALAVYALEKAIENDGVEDYADFDALARLFVLYLRLGNATEAERTARRLIAVVPTSEPARASRATRRLLVRAKDHTEQREYRIATALLTATAEIKGIDAELSAEVVAQRRAALLRHEGVQAQEDALITDSLRMCIRVRYLERLSDDERQGRLGEAVERLLDEVTADSQRVTASVEYLRREYADIAEDLGALLQEVGQRASRRTDWLNAQASARGAGGTRPGNPLVMPDTVGTGGTGTNGGTSNGSSDVGRTPGSGRKGLLGWLRGSGDSKGT